VVLGHADLGVSELVADLAGGYGGVVEEARDGLAQRVADQSGDSGVVADSPPPARGECSGDADLRADDSVTSARRHLSLVASRRPRLTLCGAPGRGVLLSPVVAGLGVSYDLRVTDMPTNLARGRCPRFRLRAPP